MYMIRCGDCGKRYDYDDDAFCPHCGAFNQPPKSVLIDESGNVKRVDGINEAGHTESFAHQEFHQEERERRRSGLDKSVRRIPRPSDTAKPQTDRSGVGTAVPRPAATGSSREKPKAVGGGVALWIFLIIILVNLLRACAGV